MARSVSGGKACVVGLVAVLAVTGLLGCGSSSSSSSVAASTGSSSSGGSSSSASPVNVLAIMTLSGPYKGFGASQKAAAVAAVKYLNSNGGIAGHHVNLTLADDAGTPTTGVTALTNYVSQHGKPFFVFASDLSVVASAILPVAQRDGILAFGPGDGNFVCATNAASACGTYFSIVLNPTVTAQVAAEYLKSKGYKHVGVLQAPETFAQEEAETLKKDLTTAGVGVTVVATPATAVDFTPQVSQLKSAGADVVAALAELGPASGYVLTAREKLGWAVPVLFDAASASTGDITTLVPKSQWSNDVCQSNYLANVPQGASVMTGRSLMLAQNPAAQQPGGFAGQPLSVAGYPWDSITSLPAFVAGAHSMDAKAIQQYLETHVVKIAHPVGHTEYVFSATSHEDKGWLPSDFVTVKPAPWTKTGVVASANPC